jgi:hypothetical protein
MFDKLQPNRVGAFTWRDDDPESSIGDGLSRPKAGVRSKIYDLMIEFENAGPMKVKLRAETKTLAVKYAKARWPQSKVTICG